MSNIPEQNLVDEIDRFLETTGEAETSFGRKALNDGSLVPRLREGRELRSATRARLRSYMATPKECPTPASFAGPNAATTPSTTPAGEGA